MNARPWAPFIRMTALLSFQLTRADRLWSWTSLTMTRRSRHYCPTKRPTRDFQKTQSLPAFERRMNKLLLDLQKSGALTSPLYNHLRSSAGKIPLLYGLPKIHKPEVPLRPIVSFVGSPSYQLSKHLAHILSPLVGNTPSHVKNSTQFPEFISQQSVAPGEILLSFDVVSLFTNVPVELACRVAEERVSTDETLMSGCGLSHKCVEDDYEDSCMKFEGWKPNTTRDMLSLMHVLAKSDLHRQRNYLVMG